MEVAWSTDDGLSDVSYSSKCEPSEACDFSWQFEDWRKISRPFGVMIFSIYCYPRMLWKKVSITLPGLESPRGGDILLEAEKDGLHCTYYMKSAFSPEFGKHHLVILKSLKISCPNFSTIRDAMHAKENHKIVSQIRVYRRHSHSDTSMMKRLSKSGGCPSPVFKRLSSKGYVSQQSKEPLSDKGSVQSSPRKIHLGRPQIITTDPERKVRIYTWISGKEQTFEGISNPSLEDLNDADHIGKFPSISPRQKDSYIPDNDGFRNLNKILPVDISEADSVSIQFHNMKFSPPTFIEFMVKSSEFIPIVTIVEDSISVEIIIKENKIFGLTMKCSNYLDTLNKFGENCVPKTF